MLHSRLDALLLALAGALLLFGGSVGCEPTLAGVDFRAKSRPSIPGAPASRPDWYMAFGGKKAPGDGEARLPYALTPPLGVAARMGVFDERALAASVGAEGCIGLRDAGSADEQRICVTYDDDPANLHITFGSEEADCAGATRATLDLDDDGVQVVARYRCGSVGPFTILDSVASLWDEGETWNLFVSASGLVKGAQVAFDDLHIATGEVGIGAPGEIAFLTFEALRLGMEAVYQLEQGDANEAVALGQEADGKLLFAFANADAPAAQKLLDKAESSFAKLLENLAKYQKGFAKVAAVEASALEALDAGT